MPGNGLDRNIGTEAPVLSSWPGRPPSLDRRRAINARSRLAKKLSAVALPKASPVLPIGGPTPSWRSAS